MDHSRNTTAPLEALEYPYQIFLITLYSFTACFAFVSNLLTIVVLVKGKRCTRDLRKFLINLSVADLLMAVFTIPFTYTNYMLGRWIFFPLMCPIVNFAQLTTITVSIYTLVAIAIDRYFAIMHPLQKSISWFKQHRTLIVLLVWMLGISIGLSQVAVSETSTFVHNSNTYVSCGERWPPESLAGQLYTAFIFSFTFALPMATLCVVYTAMGCRLLRHRVPGQHQHHHKHHHHHNQHSHLHHHRHHQAKHHHQYNQLQSCKLQVNGQVERTIKSRLISTPIQDQSLLETNLHHNNLIVDHNEDMMAHQLNNNNVQSIESNHHSANTENTDLLPSKPIVTVSENGVTESSSLVIAANQIMINKSPSTLMTSLTSSSPSPPPPPGSVETVPQTKPKLDSLPPYRHTVSNVNYTRPNSIGSIQQKSWKVICIRRNKVLKMLITIIGVFTICWLPIQIFTIMIYFKPNFLNVNSPFKYYAFVGTYFFCHWISMAHSFMNPIIYSFMSKNFKEDIKVIFSRCWSSYLIRKEYQCSFSSSPHQCIATNYHHHHQQQAPPNRNQNRPPPQAEAAATTTTAKPAATPAPSLADSADDQAVGTFPLVSESLEQAHNSQEDSVASISSKSAPISFQN